MPTPTRPTASIALGSILAFSGCASLDTSGDYEQAMSLVEARSGWRPAWNTPWSESVPAWDGTSDLSVDLAVTISLQNSREMRATLEAIALARADLVQSGLLPNPVLSLAFGVSIDGSGGATTISASLVQQFADLWLRGPRQDAASATLRQQILAVSDAALRLVADVRVAHARIVYSQRGIALIESNIELIDRSIEVAERRIRAGVATDLDANRLRQLRLGLLAERTQRRLELGVFKRDLLARMGTADFPSSWSAATDQSDRPSSVTGPSEDDIAELVRAQRLDVAAAKSSFESLAHELRVAQRGVIPNLDAGPAFDRDEDARDELGAEIDLEIPIFDTNQARIARAASEVRRARAEYEQAAQEAIGAARSAWLQAGAARELVDFYEQSVLVLARQNLDLADRTFEAGQVDMTVVLETQRQLIEAEILLNEFRATAQVSAIELEYAVGGRIVPSVETPEHVGSEENAPSVQGEG